MKKPDLMHWLFGALTLGLAASIGIAREGDDVPAERTWRAEIGKLAPDFTLSDLKGRPVTLSELRGKPVVLEWFNPTCPFVVGAHTGEGSLVDLPGRVRQDGVVWLAVNSGAPGMPGHGKEVNVKAVADWSIEYPVLLDEAGWVGRMYAARTTPHAFVIDPKGKLVYAGAVDSSQEQGAKPVNYIAEALGAIAAGERVKSPRTRPYGCGVKYAKAADVGIAAPAFTLQDLDGNDVSLADYRGHVTVIEWFNPDCPVVKKAHGSGGALETAAARWAERGVRWIAINSGAPGKQGTGERKNRTGQERWNLGHPILLDESGATGKAYGARTTPHVFVLDRRGVLAYMGGHDDGKGTSYVDPVITEVLAGEPVSTPRTRNYGCGVKY